MRYCCTETCRRQIVGILVVLALGDSLEVLKATTEHVFEQQLSSSRKLMAVAVAVGEAIANKAIHDWLITRFTGQRMPASAWLSRSNSKMGAGAEGRVAAFFFSRGLRTNLSRCVSGVFVSV